MRALLLSIFKLDAFKLVLFLIAKAKVCSKFSLVCALFCNTNRKPIIVNNAVLFILIFFFSSNQAYKTGKTINVKSVAVIKPPITTVAKGR